MKKLVTLIVYLCMASFTIVPVYAAAASVDKSNIANGIVTVNISERSEALVAAIVVKGESREQYILMHDTVNLPLQMGTGDYTINIAEQVDASNFKVIAAETVSVGEINELEMFKASIPLIDYSASVVAIPAYKQMVEGVDDFITLVYEDVVANYSYDYEKAASVASNYVPVIDNVYEAKKGICYDYSAILGGVLRSMGVPVKMVMGYTPEISTYHAWNEIYINGEWITVDTTYDAQAAAYGAEYTMAKDKSTKQIVKVF